MILKPIIEHLAINLIHNVKIILNETIKSMAHTKQFKRFVEKMFLLVSNISLEATIKEMKQVTKPLPIEGSDADKFRGFLKNVKTKINNTSGDKMKILNSHNKQKISIPRIPGKKTTGRNFAELKTQQNRNFAESKTQQNDRALDFAIKNPQKTAQIFKSFRGGGTETIDTTKYVIEPHIFPDIDIPDITPDLIKKYFYSPVKPFLQVMTCKNCNNGMFVRIKNKIICNLMKLFSTLITLLFKTGVFNKTIVLFLSV